MDTLYLPIILSTLIIILTWVWFKIKYNYWDDLKIPTLPTTIPWGHMKDMFTQKDSFGDQYLNIYRALKDKGVKHGGVYLLWLPIYVPIDLDIVKSVLQVNFQHFVDRGFYQNEKIDPLNAHLVNLSGKRWKLLRSKLTPTFTTGRIKMMFDILIECTSGLYKVMETQVGTAVDIKDILGRFTTDVIGTCAFGLDCNSLENPKSEFREKGLELFHKTFLENIKAFLMFAFPNMMKNVFNARAISEETTDFFMRTVKETVAYREKNNINRKDFLHLLIQLKNRGKLVDDEKIDEEKISIDENNLTIDELVAQAFIFFEAGFETASTTMTFCLYELSKNKKIQDKVRSEIRNVLSKYGGKFTYDAIMEMHYLDHAVNETLRKYPPLPVLNRICTKEYKLPGTDAVLQKGVRVAIPIMGIQRDPEIYPDPEKFDPERFSEENRKTRPLFAFLPFGEGPRMCIAARFGLLQSKVGLASLLLKYEFELNQKTQEPLKFTTSSFILMAQGGIWLDYKKVN